MEREREMDFGSEMGSRESLTSRLSRFTESIVTAQGSSVPQRPRDPRRPRETHIIKREKKNVIS